MCTPTSWQHAIGSSIASIAQARRALGYAPRYSPLDAPHEVHEVLALSHLNLWSICSINIVD
jgi:hypothetical protein